MKNLSFINVLLILVFFLSCNPNEPTSPDGDNQQNGKLFLRIDKAKAPESVIWVEATLTRDGFDPISGTMNLLSDSTADLVLENIQAGEWHLKVDAKDSAELILYTGETEVQVFAGFTTQVNLVLEPTGAGVGNINIWVTWGIPTSGNWTDYSGNPILSPSGSYYETHGVGQANVLFLNGTYKMWYLGDAGGSHKYVMYAESNDGINWTRPYPNPVLSPGEIGSWDDLAVHPGTVIYEDGNYYMFYSGWSDPSGRWDIGFAESVDGINWTKYPEPVLMGTSGWEYQIGPSSIIKIDSTYYLYYYMRYLPYLRIGLAMSTDRINWTRYPGNPVLTYDESWEGTGIYYPTVYEKNGQFEMIYMNQPGTGFGRATSINGINWEKDDSNPFFNLEDTYNHWANFKIAYPYYRKVNNQERIYYTGFITSGIYKIGFVSR
jgi:beta-1,2-mannobiose phosphorylase / 1,2-beta-oligomannan phosphorylase